MCTVNEVCVFLQATYIQEMSAGLFDLPNAEEEEEGTAPSNPPVRRENKKTERQRKKQEANKKKVNHDYK